jgi:hypothetical protein
MDLRRSTLKIKLRLAKALEQPVTKDANVGLVNLPLQGVFRKWIAVSNRLPLRRPEPITRTKPTSIRYWRRVPTTECTVISIISSTVFYVFILEIILSIFEGLRRALILFTKLSVRLKTCFEGIDDAGMARYFLALKAYSLQQILQINIASFLW